MPTSQPLPNTKFLATPNPPTPQSSGEGMQTTQLTGKLSIVDLAGSERVKRSGADEVKTRMKEAININTSLLGLSNVMKVS